MYNILDPNSQGAYLPTMFDDPFDEVRKAGGNFYGKVSNNFKHTYFFKHKET